MTAKDLMMEKGSFMATGIIKNITGELNKVYPKSGWTGSKAEITLDINGRRQKISVFGGVGASEFPIRVFQRDAEGKIARDKDGKTIQHSIPIEQYDDKKFAFFDKKEVIEWGERGEDGKPKRLSFIEELSDGRFANALVDNKELLIGKRVQIKGSVSFKPTQDFSKINTEMSVNQIVILPTLEDGKEVVDKFIINSHFILNTEALDSVKDGVLPVYVPMYHKYVTPIKRDGKEVKGRTVYVPMSFIASEESFMGIGVEYGFDMSARTDMFRGKIESVAGDSPFVVVKSCLVNKSGVVEREIKVEELLEDQVYGRYAKKAIQENSVDKFLAMYKAQNPLTVRGEFKQEVQFISPVQLKDKENDVVREGIFPIDVQAIETYTLDKIKEESESNVKTNVQQTKEIPTPKVNTVNTVIPQTNFDINEMDDMDAFLF